MPWTRRTVLVPFLILASCTGPVPAGESGLGHLSVDRDGRLVLAVDADGDGGTDVAYVADPAPPASDLAGLAPRTGPFHVALDGPCLAVRDLESHRALVVSTRDPRACAVGHGDAALDVVRSRTSGIARVTDPEWLAAPAEFDASAILVRDEAITPDRIRCAVERCLVTFDGSCQVGGPGSVHASVHCGAGGFLGGSIDGQRHTVTCGPDHYACGRCDGPVGYARCHPNNCFDRVDGIYTMCDPDEPPPPVVPES
jgi:hypothetical protein